MIFDPWKIPLDVYVSPCFAYSRQRAVDPLPVRAILFDTRHGRTRRNAGVERCEQTSQLKEIYRIMPTCPSAASAFSDSVTQAYSAPIS